MVKERKGEMSSGMYLKYKRCLGGVELSIFTCSQSKWMVEAREGQCYVGVMCRECQHGIGCSKVRIDD